MLMAVLPQRGLVLPPQTSVCRLTHISLGSRRHPRRRLFRTPPLSDVGFPLLHVSRNHIFLDNELFAKLKLPEASRIKPSYEVVNIFRVLVVAPLASCEDASRALLQGLATRWCHSENAVIF